MCRNLVENLVENLIDKCPQKGRELLRRLKDALAESRMT
jgi:hypothetical protein